MIVSNAFPGDDDLPTKMVQHESYPTALRVLVDGPVAALTNAYRLTDRDVPEALTDLSHGALFDHRVVQAAHDHLAAVWRFRTGHVDTSLPFPFAEEGRVAAEWIDWLRSVVASWAQEDDQLVRLVTRAVTHANSPEGYAAEDQLEKRLRERYPLPTKLPGAA